MKKTAKILSVFIANAIAISMVLSTAVSAQGFVRNAVVGDANSVYLGTGTRRAMPIGANEVLGQVIFVPGGNRLTKVTLECASWGNSIGDLTINIYKWTGDYDTSVRGQILASKSFHNFADNSPLTIVLSSEKNLTGQLLVTLGNSTETVGAWYYSEPTSPDYPFYKNGEPLTAGFNGKFFWAPLNDNRTNISDVQRSAYETITLGEFDKGEGVSKGGITLEGVKHATLSVTDGSYAGYGNVDFGLEGAKGVEIVVRSVGVNDDAAQIQVVLDNPESGMIIAECQLEYRDYEDFTETLTCEITEKVTGVHNVYVTFTEGGYYPLEMKFTKDVPREDFYAKRLREFNETKDFTLKSTYSDTWTATDMLGRKVADYSEAGRFNPDKQVGMFYWTWHARKSKLNLNSFSNNQAVLDTYNGDINEIKNDYNYGKWGDLGYWNESVYGHYHGLDEWVMRKQLELLSAAGVDGLFFDSTNGAWTWTGGYMRLGQVMHDMHRDGIQTPGMAFILPFSDNENAVSSLESVYEHMYSKGLYSDCWYYFDGKPVIMAYYDTLTMETEYADINKQHKEIRNFFTFRPPQASYFTGPAREDHWPWLEVYPQHPFGTSKDYGCEVVCVGVAQNASDAGLVAMNGYDVYGRSYTYKDRFSKLSDTSKYYGYNFQEQWDRAHALDPELVFVTGWNEWTAGHHDVWGADNAKGAYPDQFSDEYSRDIEPTKGDFKDTYYYQLVDNVRKFKGVRPAPEASAEKTIDLTGDFAQWEEVGPEFIGYRGGTEPRNARMSNVTGVKKYYTNDTGRNDIVMSKAARDSENLYFYVETAENLTPHTDDNWMRLFVNSDRSYKTGWEGYDYAVNIEKGSADKLVISKSMGGWKWETVGDADYRVAGNKMMLAVPRSLMEIGENVDIEFKWNDNMQEQGDIMDFYVNGDTAPIGRFNYHYFEDTPKKLEDEPVEPKKTDRDILKYSIVMRVGKSKAFVKNEETLIDTNNPDVHPMIVNDKTMVPVRFLSENLGARVTWEEATQTARIVLNNKRIFITVGSDIMQVEKEKIVLQSPAIEQNGRIYVPLRDVVEMSGETCTWLEPDIIVVGGKTDAIYGSETMVDTINLMFE